MHAEGNEINRRDALKKAAVGAATAGAVVTAGSAWSAPQIKSLLVRPAYAAAASGPMTFTFALDGQQASTGSTATGTGTVVVDPVTGQINYDITWMGLGGTVVVAHIHSGVAGTNGPPVLTLTVTDAGTTGAAQMGSAVDATLATAICANPENYYVNVHSTVFGAGEIRGQLA